MLRTERLNRVLEVNTEKNYVVAQGGIVLSDLHSRLAQHGLAMINVGSISDQTLAGIITTATHGTGIHFGVISTHVLFLTLLLADGSRITCSRNENSELFTATICGLGCTGVVLSIGLQVEPAFRLEEVQYTQPFDDVVRNFDTVVQSAEHVRMWWYPAADSICVSQSNRTQAPRKPAGSWFWDWLMGHHAIQLLLFLGLFFPDLNILTARFARWLGSSKPVGIDDSHRIFNVDCRYLQYTIEWAIPYVNSQPCLEELRAWLGVHLKDPYGLRPHFPIEIRFSAPDDIWLSPSSGQYTCWIGIIQFKPYGLPVPYQKLFTQFEDILIRHQGRPHWAKAHAFRRETLRTLYPRFDDFVKVLEQVDPHGRFRNEYIQRHFFGAPVHGRVFKQHNAVQRTH